MNSVFTRTVLPFTGAIFLSKPLANLETLHISKITESGKWTLSPRNHLLWPGSGPLIRARPLVQRHLSLPAFLWAPQCRIAKAHRRSCRNRTACAVPRWCQMQANEQWWDFRGEVMLPSGQYAPSPHSISTSSSTVLLTSPGPRRDPLLTISLSSSTKDTGGFPALSSLAGHQPGPGSPLLLSSLLDLATFSSRSFCAYSRQPSLSSTLPLVPQSYRPWENIYTCPLYPEFPISQC